MSFPGGASGEEPACQLQEIQTVLIPGSGRSPREGHGNPVQYSCLENPRNKEPSGPESIGSQRVGHD